MKLAFVTPRYGAEVTDGIEHACRLLAEQVSDRHDVDVLTTCARDPHTWKNEYAEGMDRVRGVLVRRFSVSHLHDQIAFGQLSHRLFSGEHSRQDELEWVRRLGPTSPGLLDFLKRQQRQYDAIVFFSLLHATTVQGLQVAPERSLIFPHLMLHPALRFTLWNDMLTGVRGFGYVSPTERAVAHAYLRSRPADDEVVGIGVGAPTPLSYPRHQQDPADNPVAADDLPVTSDEAAEPDYLDGRGIPFRRRHRLHGPFVLYGGRVGPDNGCEEMLEYFDAYAQGDADTALVLMGVKMMKLPEARYLRLAGVLPARDRMSACEAALVTVAPSAGDLVAESVLESLAVGTPVLVSELNAAAAEHCRESNGGLYYANREEFVEALRRLTGNAQLRERLGEHGRQYIQQHHRWDAVLGRFERLLGRLKTR